MPSDANLMKNMDYVVVRLRDGEEIMYQDFMYRKQAEDFAELAAARFPSDDVKIMTNVQFAEWRKAQKNTPDKKHWYWK
jgi:hypothetical protein